MLAFPGRYYRTLPITNPAYEVEAVALDPARTALVAMHCWDIGCEGGAPLMDDYWVGMGFPETMREAERTMVECIRPAMDAARQAGVLVCHVESAQIGARHQEAQEGREVSPPGQVASPPGPLAVRERGSEAAGAEPEPVVPGWREQMVTRFHGADYATRSGYATMDRAKIVAPLPGEPFAYETDQFDRLLRRHSIENLIYCGFATDMCVLRAPGGIEPMAGYGYRLYLLRDATLGVECPDNFAERIATRWGIRYFETHYGDTLTTGEFIEACEAMGREG
jgi:nicotinamidase-related amidase